MDFDFDLGADTAMSVASEMVEDLSLSAEDARAVAAAIRDEIKLLTGLLNRHANDSLASSSNGVRTWLASYRHVTTLTLLLKKEQQLASVQAGHTCDA